MKNRFLQLTGLSVSRSLTNMIPRFRKRGFTAIGKNWYNGFTFGTKRGIYNPWSIINYLDKHRISTYWANTSSNSLVDKLIRAGSPDIKMDMETLLWGKYLSKEIDEQIVFHQLDEDENAVWSLLLASGYLKVEGFDPEGTPEKSYIS